MLQNQLRVIYIVQTVNGKKRIAQLADFFEETMKTLYVWYNSLGTKFLDTKFQFTAYLSTNAVGTWHERVDI